MEKVSTEKQLEILDAALGLFSKKGFERTTVDEIASQAGVGKGTVYLYFSNKEQIFLAIIERGLTDLQSLYEKISTTQDFYRQFHDIIYTNLEYVEHHQDFYRIFIKERLNLKVLRDEHTKRLLLEKHAKLHEVLVSFIQGGIDSGYLRPGDPSHYCIALTGVLNHFVMHWFLQGTPDSLTAKTDSILDIIFSGIKQQGI